MLRILILLCINIHLAQFRNIEYGRNTWYNEDVPQNSLSRSGEIIYENDSDKHDSAFNKETQTDGQNNRRSLIIKWVKRVLSPNKPRYHKRSFEDMTRQKKDQLEENINNVLQGLSEVLDGLNRNLKVHSSDMTRQLPEPDDRSRTRHKRSVTADVSYEMAEVSNETVRVLNEMAGVLNVTAEFSNETVDTNEGGAYVSNVTEENKHHKAEEKTSEEILDKLFYVEDKSIELTADNSTINKENNTLLSHSLINTNNETAANNTENTTTKEQLTTNTESEKLTSLRNNTNNEDISVERNETAKEIITSQIKNILRTDILTDGAVIESAPVMHYHDDVSAVLGDIPASAQDTSDAAEYEPNARRASYSNISIKEKLLHYLDDMFNELARKIQPLTKVKLALSPDNSYRIGYIVANIDTLDVKLMRMRQNLNANKFYWNEAQIIEMFDQLKVTNNVVSNLINTLGSYLPAPII